MVNYRKVAKAGVFWILGGGGSVVWGAVMIIRFLSFLGIVLLLAVTPASAQERIGQIKEARGDVQVERNGSRSSVRVGDDVLRSDVLLTGANSAVGLTLLDKSTYALGPNSRMVMQQFSYNRSGGSRIRLSLSEGELVGRSGEVAKQDPNAMQIELPTSVAGIRGTHFLMRADLDSLYDGESPSTPAGAVDAFDQTGVGGGDSDADRGGESDGDTGGDSEGEGGRGNDGNEGRGSDSDSDL